MRTELRIHRMYRSFINASREYQRHDTGHSWHWYMTVTYLANVVLYLTLARKLFTCEYQVKSFIRRFYVNERSEIQVRTRYNSFSRSQI